MPITQGQAQIFVDEKLRRHCEQIRSALATLGPDLLTWSEGYSDFFAPAGVPANSLFIDGRKDNPPFLVTAQNVADLMTATQALASLATPQLSALLNLFCVQPIQVS